MVKLRSRLMSVALLVALMLMASPVVVASAHARPPQNVTPNIDANTCTGAPSAANCDGVDPAYIYPNGSSCASDGQTIATFVVTNSDGSTLAYNELRWSNRCKSNWVRMTADHRFSYTMKASIYNYCSGSPNYGLPNYSASVQDPDGGTVIWTPMIYAPSNSVTMKGQALSSSVSHCY